MKVALVHNFYRFRGGEDGVVVREAELLRNAGHKVLPFFRDSAEELASTNLSQKIDLSLSLPFRQEVYGAFSRFLREEKPEVVHVHNTFPLLSPAVLAAASESAIPVVMTLHNFRFICANGLFLRDSRPCEKCLKGSPLWGTIFGCYRDSIAATLPMTRLVKTYEKGRRLADWVTRFIVLSPFSRAKFLEAGFPDAKLKVRPNFCEDPGNIPAWEKRDPFVLFVGRFGEEKGVIPLLKAASQFGIPLKLAGSGPLESVARAMRLSNVEFLGSRTPTQVRVLMRRASLLVIPSICYENFPLVLAEAWSNGLPVAASRIGSLESLIRDGVTGLHFEPGNVSSMANVIQGAFAAPERLRLLGEASRMAYSQTLSPSVARASIEEIYRQAIESVK